MKRTKEVERERTEEEKEGEGAKGRSDIRKKE